MRLLDAAAVRALCASARGGADVFGAALSVGTLVNLVRHGAERLVGVEHEIKAALRQAPVLHHDETGLRVVGAEGARLEWTHVTCTPTLTHYARHAARGATALEAIGILPGYEGSECARRLDELSPLSDRASRALQRPPSARADLRP